MEGIVIQKIINKNLVQIQKNWIPKNLHMTANNPI